MPADRCLAHLARRDWLTSGPLNELVASYIELLQTRRYADGTLAAYLGCLAHLSYWMAGERLTAANLDRTLIGRFLRQHLPTCTCPAPRRCDLKEVRAALHQLLTLLPAPGDGGTATSGIAVELRRFGDHLRDTCGLAPLTCSYRIRHVEAFLTGRFGIDVPEIGLLAPTDIDAFLNGLAARWKPASCKVICTSLRSYLRFRAMRGDDTRILITTLPAIANWPRRHVAAR